MWYTLPITCSQTSNQTLFPTTGYSPQLQPICSIFHFVYPPTHSKPERTNKKKIYMNQAKPAEAAAKIVTATAIAPLF